MIDTLKAQEAGFTKDQIEVLRDLDKASVTKDYMDAKLAALDAKLDGRFASVETNIKWLMWTNGLVLALLIGLYFKR